MRLAARVRHEERRVSHVKQAAQQEAYDARVRPLHVHAARARRLYAALKASDERQQGVVVRRRRRIVHVQRYDGRVQHVY